MSVDVYSPDVGQSPAELRQAVHLYRQSKVKRVLEIGTLYGGTLNAWLNENPELVVAVDPEFRRRDFDVPNGTELILIDGRSQNLDTIDRIKEQAPFDWVFIDGDHQYEAVRWDSILALSVTRHGGHILFHDIVPPEGWEATPPGRVFAELSAEHQAWSYIEPRPEGYPAESANGIGVIRV